jgi:hypothetical protein
MMVGLGEQPLHFQTRHQLLGSKIQEELGIGAGEDVFQEIHL